jgi:uncharacterized protein (UPF0332 family)
MNFEECIRKNLIRENNDAKEWIGNELNAADKFLVQAKVILNAEQYEAAEIIAYTSIFHLARALLYSKGYSEKSHYCLFAAMDELFGKELGELGRKAHYLREARHIAVYGGKTVSKEEAGHAVSLAEDFRKATEKILRKK